MSIINMNVQEHPILVDKYLLGREIEVDAICDGENVLILRADDIYAVVE